MAGRRGQRGQGGFAAAEGSPARARRAARDGAGPYANAGPYAGTRREASARSGAEAELEADPEAVARQICLRMLTAAPRTQAQLADALRRKGVPDEAASAVLARFAEVKLIDDAMFARAWVDSRHYGRGLASRALGAELRQRGVAQDDIRAALSELDPEQEHATARDLVARRLASTAGQPAETRIRRLAGMLARKGYPAGLAYRVVREALEQEADDGHVPLHELADLPEPDDNGEAAEA